MQFLLSLRSMRSAQSTDGPSTLIRCVKLEAHRIQFTLLPQLLSANHPLFLWPRLRAKMRNLTPRHIRGGCYQAQNYLLSLDSDRRQSNESYRQKRPLNISSMALREIIALGAGAYTSRTMALA